MSTHSRLSPSSSKAWTECTIQPSYVERNAYRIPPDRGSAYADEGTLAHKYGEEVLREMLGIDEVPDAFRPFIRTYVDSCTALLHPDSQVFIEWPVSLFYKPEDIGTVDFLAISDKGIHVRDLKYGAGVLVNSEYNKQLAIYAWSAICALEHLYDFPPAFPVTIHAIQPRHHEWVDVPWVTTIGELRTFCETEIAPKAAAILSDSPDLVFAPSPDACRWCAAKGFCEARAAWLRELPSSINPLDHCEDLDAPAPEGLSDEQLLSVFKHAKLIGSFIEDVGKYLLQRALSGNPLGGTKTVRGRAPNRAWSDENVVNALLEQVGLKEFDKRYKTSLRSVADIEKQLKEMSVDPKVLEPVTTRGEGQVVLALEGDKRPAVSVSLAELSNLDSDGED